MDPLVLLTILTVVTYVSMLVADVARLDTDAIRSYSYVAMIMFTINLVVVLLRVF